MFPEAARRPGEGRPVAACGETAHQQSWPELLAGGEDTTDLTIYTAAVLGRKGGPTSPCLIVIPVAGWVPDQSVLSDLRWVVPPCYLTAV